MNEELRGGLDYTHCAADAFICDPVQRVLCADVFVCAFWCITALSCSEESAVMLSIMRFC